MKSCPFCGGKVENHPSGEYLICRHDPYCFMLNKSNTKDKNTHFDFTLIPNTERYRKAWERRS